MKSICEYKILNSFINNNFFNSRFTRLTFNCIKNYHYSCLRNIYGIKITNLLIDYKKDCIVNDKTISVIEAICVRLSNEILHILEQENNISNYNVFTFYISFIDKKIEVNSYSNNSKEQKNYKFK